MKKLLSKFSFIVAISILIGTVNISIFDLEVRANASDCNLLISINEDESDAEITLNNNTADSVSGNLIISMYKNNGKVLDNNTIVPVTIEGNGKNVSKYNLSLDCTLIKAFFWSDFDSLIPLAEASEKIVMHPTDGSTILKGIVTQNPYTNLKNPEVINTASESGIGLYITDNGGNQNYKPESVSMLKNGNTDISDWLGYNVIVKIDDTGTIIEAEKDNQINSSTSFNLDRFGFYETSSNHGYLSYLKNDSDRTYTKLLIEDEPSIIYNGIAYSGTLESLFGCYDGDESGLIYKDNFYSGKITVLDNDSVSGYDVIFVDVVVSAVVNEVTSDGIVLFKNTPGDTEHMNSFSQINFNASVTNIYTKLTKDGLPYDYTKLKEWDIISIVANNHDAMGEYYVMKVIDGATVKGTITETVSSNTSYGKIAYVINGNKYDLEEGCYGTEHLENGLLITFYLNEYGKVVLANIDRSESYDYGYITDVQVASGGFGYYAPCMQVLCSNGTVNIYDFAETVVIDNPSVKIKEIVKEDSDSVYFEYNNYDYEDLYESLMTMVGTVVLFKASDGHIDSLVMAETNASTAYSELFCEGVDAYRASSFEEEKRQINLGGNKTYNVADDTLIFYIGSSGDSFKYNSPAAGEPVKNCSVGLGADLKTNSQFSAVVYSNCIGGDVSVIVIYNSDSGISVQSGIACIKSVGEALSNGNRVLSITFYQDGELKKAITDDISVGNYLNHSTYPGSLFKFGFKNDIIVSAVPYLVFNYNIRDRISEGDDFSKCGIPKAEYADTDGVFDGEKVYYGAVVEKNGDTFTIAPAVEYGITSLDPADWKSVTLSGCTVNSYLYNPVMIGNAKLQPSSLDDILVDNILANDGGKGSYEIEFGGVTKPAPAFGMLDFVYIRIYDNKADIIDYASWQYGYSFIKQ